MWVQVMSWDIEDGTLPWLDLGTVLPDAVVEIRGARIGTASQVDTTRSHVSEGILKRTANSLKAFDLQMRNMTVAVMASEGDRDGMLQLANSGQGEACWIVGKRCLVPPGRVGRNFPMLADSLRIMGMRAYGRGNKPVPLQAGLGSLTPELWREGEFLASLYVDVTPNLHRTSGR